VSEIPDRTRGGYPTRAPYLARVDVASMTFRSCATLGMWWLVWCYREIALYRQLSNRRLLGLRGLFWLLIGSLAVTIATAWQSSIRGVPFAFLTIVLGAVFVLAFARARDQAIEQYALLGGLPSRLLVIGLFSVAVALSLTHVGVVLMFVPLTAFFIFTYQWHNRVVDAVEAQGFSWADG